VHYLNERYLLIFLLQFLVILGLCRATGMLLQRIRQPTITADMLVGMLLGPTILGRFFPTIHLFLFPNDPVQKTMLETLAWVGIFFLLLDTGLEVNFSNIWKQRKQSLKISMLDLIVPIILTGIPLYFMPARYLTNPQNRVLLTLFLATIMTISAMPVAIRALHDLNILKTDMGFVTISALTINDIIGWIVFTILLGVVTRHRFSAVHILTVFGATVLFALFCLTIVRRISEWIIRWTKKNFPEQSGLTITYIALIGMACGAATLKIGIHSLFGFFIAGLIAGEAKELSERDRNVFSKMVYAIFIPVFFANIGLKVDFFRGFDLPLTLFITVIGVAGRFSAAWFGAVWARRPRSNRVPIAIAHTPGGEMHLVVSMLALEYGLIRENVFIAIVCAAVLSSVTLGPWLKLAIQKRMFISVQNLSSKALVLPNLPATQKNEALQSVCAEAANALNQRKVSIYEAVLQREQAMSTAVEEGIAFPHARIPRLRRPFVVLATSGSGIEWDSPDGKLTRIIFLILTPVDEQDAQLQILRELSRAMSLNENREILLEEGQEPDYIRRMLNIMLNSTIQPPNTK
jgi:Kef-type K+ transport system membrane component KefB